MHFTKVFAFATLLAAGALAAPAADANNPPPPPPKPVKPPPPSPTNVQQVNACGNNAQPYCCNANEFGGYSTCYAFQFSSQCSATTVCCNANNSIQVCIGNAEIVPKPN